MPREFFRKLSPDHNQIRKHRFISLFGEILHEPNLWHMNHYLPGILAVQAGLAADKAVELVDAGGLAANAESAPGAPVEGD